MEKRKNMRLATGMLAAVLLIGTSGQTWAREEADIGWIAMPTGDMAERELSKPMEMLSSSDTENLNKKMAEYMQDGQTLLRNKNTEFYYYVNLDPVAKEIYDVMYQVAQDPVNEGNIGLMMTDMDPQTSEFYYEFNMAYRALCFDHPVTMSDDAEEYFYEWYNGIIDAVNAIEDDADVESRKMKLNGHVARLALLFQVMKWATDSGDMQYIERDSVESAIRMIDYYEETYRRIQETIVINSIGETKEAWLSLLEERFTSGDAVIAGRKVDMSRRTVYYALDQLCRLKHPLIEKLQHGVYRKLMTENTDAPCTIALSSCQDTVQSSQSAKVQSATTLKSEGHE